MGKTKLGENQIVHYEIQQVPGQIKEDTKPLEWTVNPEPETLDQEDTVVADDRPWEKDLSQIYTDGRLYRCECGVDSPIQWVPGQGYTHVACGHYTFSQRCNGCGQ